MATWLTLEQAAAKLQSSVGTVRSLIKNKRLDSTLIGNSYRIKEEDLGNIKPAPARKAWKRKKVEEPLAPPKKEVKPAVNSKKEALAGS